MARTARWQDGLWSLTLLLVSADGGPLCEEAPGTYAVGDSHFILQSDPANGIDFTGFYDNAPSFVLRGRIFRNCVGMFESNGSTPQLFKVEARGITLQSGQSWDRQVLAPSLPAARPSAGSAESEAEGTMEDMTVAITVAVMLFVMLSLTVGLLYLANCPDDDIQLYTFIMINDTMSVFCAVLLNQALFAVCVDQIINGQHPLLLRRFFGEPNHHVSGTFACFVFLAFWFLMIWLCSRAVMPDHGCRSCNCFIDDSSEEAEHRGIHVLEDGSRFRRSKHSHVRLYAWSHFGGHCIAFAGIYAATEFLHGGNHGDTGSIGLTLVTVGCFIVSIASVYVISAVLVNKYIGVKSLGPSYKMFVRFIKEGQIDAVALTMSFAFNQLLCQTVLSELPSLHGRQPHMTLLDVYKMSICAIVVMILYLIVHIRLFKPLENRRHYSTALIVIRNGLAMSVSWCIQFVSLWSMQLFFKNTPQVTGGLVAVINAFFVSVMSVVLIIVVDKVADTIEEQTNVRRNSDYEDVVSFARSDGADSQMLHQEVGRSLRGIIVSIGLVVALAWDKAFDVAMETVVEGMNTVSEELTGSPHSVIFKCLLGFSMVLYVAPAWYMFIVPKVMCLEEAHEEKEKEAAEAALTDDSHLSSFEQEAACKATAAGRS